jgi:predicted nucleic acid-binding protein
MILVDTGVWIDYFRGVVTPQSEKLDTLLGVEQVSTGDLILTEVLQGFVSERDFNQAARLWSLDFEPLCVCANKRGFAGSEESSNGRAILMQ